MEANSSAMSIAAVSRRRCSMWKLGLASILANHCIPQHVPWCISGVSLHKSYMLGLFSSAFTPSSCQSRRSDRPKQRIKHTHSIQKRALSDEQLHGTAETQAVCDSSHHWPPQKIFTVRKIHFAAQTMQKSMWKSRTRIHFFPQAEVIIESRNVTISLCTSLVMSRTSSNICTIFHHKQNNEGLQHFISNVTSLYVDGTNVRALDYGPNHLLYYKHFKLLVLREEHLNHYQTDNKINYWGIIQCADFFPTCVLFFCPAPVWMFELS